MSLLNAKPYLSSIVASYGGGAQTITRAIDSLMAKENRETHGHKVVNFLCSQYCFCNMVFASPVPIVKLLKLTKVYYNLLTLAKVS